MFTNMNLKVKWLEKEKCLGLAVQCNKCKRYTLSPNVKKKLQEVNTGWLKHEYSSGCKQN